jgi:uncharacterized protein YdaU (DUF1376 family)
MKSPAFQFYVQDFLVGTADMIAEERGVYIVLLCYQWAKGFLPDDITVLMRLSGGSRKSVTRVMAKFVKGDDGNLRNQRLEGEREKQRNFSASRSANAQKRYSKCTASASPVQCTDPALQSSSSSSDNTPIVPKGTGVGFDAFWAAYPKKKAKGAALKAWAKIKGVHELLPQILESVRQQTGSPEWQKECGRYIPHPATWLNGQGWSDEVEIAIAAQSFRPPEPVQSDFGGAA